MRKTLNHLTQQHQNELEEVCTIVLNNISVDKMILFGSFARGDWVSDRYKEGHVTYEYQSDFDILVVVDSEKVAENSKLWQEVRDAIRSSKKIDTPVSLVIDTLHFVNKKLDEGNYFYLDILSEGVLLHDSQRGEFIKPELIDPQKRKELALKDYSFWMEKSESFFNDYEHNIEDNQLSNAAFHLSQAVEALYFALLLVFTGYKPKTHKLEKIEEHLKDILPDFPGYFDRSTSEGSRLFELLNSAYIDARYKQDFSVEKSDLEKLYIFAQSLSEEVSRACTERINSF